MKKKLAIAGGILILAAAAGAGIWYEKTRDQGNEDAAPSAPPQIQGTDLVTATGTTSAGLIEKTLDLDFLDTDLIVDEVYVSSADEVEAGAKVLKITDNSLLEAKRELERAKMDASLAYRQGLIDYENDKLDAENTYQKSRIESDFAQIVYDNTIAKAQADVQKAEKELSDAQELVEEYTAAIEDDYYYKDHQVEEKKAAYEKNVALFFEKLDDYGYELDDDDDDDPNTFNIVKSQEKGGGGGQDTDGESTVLQLLKSEYQENKEEYDQAVKDYEADTEKARAGIAEAADDLQLKQLKLQEAQIALEKAKVSAQAEYDASVIKGEKAKSAYQTELKSLEETLETLADEEEEAAENYDLFMETIGDGYIYTESTGMILMMRASENTALSKDGVLMAYSDMDTMQVAAAVDQSDISRIEIGETAAVVMEGYDTYTGVVTQINPVSESTSRASVSYHVTLELQGDTDGLPANVTANVYFGITAEDYDKLRSQSRQDTENASDTFKENEDAQSPNAGGHDTGKGGVSDTDQDIGGGRNGEGASGADRSGASDTDGKEGLAAGSAEGR